MQSEIIFSVVIPIYNEEENIPELYRRLHLLKYYRKTYRYKEGDFPVAEDIGRRTISLPLYPKLRNEEVLYIIKTVKEVMSGKS